MANRYVRVRDHAGHQCLAACNADTGEHWIEATGDTNDCSCLGAEVDSDCPQHGQYSEQGHVHRTQATFTLESLKNAARNLRVAFDAGFEVICDESTVGLNEWAVSEIERLHRAFDGMSARYDDAEAEVKRLRGEMNRLKSLFTDSRHILGKCGAHHCEPGCKATWVTYV